MMRSTGELSNRPTAHDSFFIKGKALFLDDDVMKKERVTCTQRRKHLRIKAAIRIQAFFRGLSVRLNVGRHLTELKRQQAELLETEGRLQRREQAARTIQRAVRHMLTLPTLAKPRAKRLILERLGTEVPLTYDFWEYPSADFEEISFNVSKESTEDPLDVITRNECFRLLPALQTASASSLQVSKIYDELHFSRMEFCKSMMFEEPSILEDKQKEDRQKEDKQAQLQTSLDLLLKVKSKT
jgi:hypothetical protein